MYEVLRHASKETYLQRLGMLTTFRNLTDAAGGENRLLSEVFETMLHSEDTHTKVGHRQGVIWLFRFWSILVVLMRISCLCLPGGVGSDQARAYCGTDRMITLSVCIPRQGESFGCFGFDPFVCYFPQSSKAISTKQVSCRHAKLVAVGFPRRALIASKLCFGSSMYRA